MRKKVKLRMFKNDPFGIKWKIFGIRLKHWMKTGIKVRTKALAAYLNIVNDIGIPRDDEEKEFLKKVVGSYDETIQKLEENLRYSRMYIKDDEE